MNNTRYVYAERVDDRTDACAPVAYELHDAEYVRMPAHGDVPYAREILSVARQIAAAAPPTIPDGEVFDFEGVPVAVSRKRWKDGSYGPASCDRAAIAAIFRRRSIGVIVDRFWL